MDKINHSSFYTYSKDKTLLHGMFWLPKEEVKAVICLVHGLGGHVARFAHVADFFCEEKIGFIGVDLRGHGKSHGKPGVVKSLECYYEDIHQAVKYVKGFVEDDIPLYLYGNSMGGPIALKFAMDNQELFKGVVLAAPWFKLVKQPGSVVLQMLSIMGVLFPGISFSTGVKSEEFRSSEEMQEKAKNDPLVHKQISPRLFCEIDKLGTYLLEKRWANFHLPVLVFHGDNDKVTDISASLEYYKKNQTNTMFIALPGTKHEIHVEAEGGSMLKQIVHWIDHEGSLSRNEMEITESLTLV